MKEFKSFLKTVGGNEGDKCNYPTRLDLYGCGCAHDCKYCYAKSLLSFRGLWDAENPAVADIVKVKRAIAKLPKGSVVRLGGMTDCFQPLERQTGITREAIETLNSAGVGYLIVTKSDLVAEYADVMDKDLAHIQVSLTCTNDGLYRKLGYEKAPVPSRRIAAIEELQELEFDVQVRLSPFIPDYIDLNVLNSIKCDKILVEFLRVNSWVRKWFNNLDYSPYTISHKGYLHLPLEMKKELIKGITGFKRVTVCEDEDEAYGYWKECFNPNKEDCCDLRR